MATLDEVVEKEATEALARLLASLAARDVGARRGADPRFSSVVAQFDGYQAG